MATYQLPPENHLYTDPSPPQVSVILAKGGFLLPDKPAHDPATHTEPVWNVISQEWENRLLTVEELAEATKKAEGEVQKTNLINVYNAMFNGTGTTGERATRLEKSLCWIVRHNLDLVD